MTFTIKLRPIQFGFSVEGDRFEVFPVVENPTDSKATDTVTLFVDGSKKDSRSLRLDANNSETVTLTWDVDVSSNKVLPIKVETGSDSASDEATFRVYDDTIRVRIDNETRSKNISHKEAFVKDPSKVRK